MRAILVVKLQEPVGIITSEPRRIEAPGPLHGLPPGRLLGLVQQELAALETEKRVLQARPHLTDGAYLGRAFHMRQPQYFLYTAK
jgi:hypothetical protein